LSEVRDAGVLLCSGEQPEATLLEDAETDVDDAQRFGQDDYYPADDDDEGKHLTLCTAQK